MESLLLFFLNVILGYCLQSAGYLIVVHAAGHVKINIKNLILMSVGIGLLSWGIRSITLLTFGFHTILIMICIILLSVFILKTQVFSTVVGVLCSSVLVLCCEMIMIGILSLCGMSDVLNYDDIIAQKITKALCGVPTNIMLIAISAVIYKIRMKYHKEKEQSGEVSEADS